MRTPRASSRTASAPSEGPAHAAAQGDIAGFSGYVGQNPSERFTAEKGIPVLRGPEKQFLFGAEVGVEDEEMPSTLPSPPVLRGLGHGDRVQRNDLEFRAAVRACKKLALQNFGGKNDVPSQTIH